MGTRIIKPNIRVRTGRVDARKCTNKCLSKIQYPKVNNKRKDQGSKIPICKGTRLRQNELKTQSAYPEHKVQN